MQVENTKNVTGKLILILGPSGSGKGTLIKYVKENYPDFVFPVSCTTRAPRPGEKDGDVYYFLSKEEFKQKMANDEFLEWAVVHGDNYYGTLKAEILEPLKEGKTVFREVDVQGVESIQQLIPNKNLTTIFITTESWKDLEQRITGRAKINPEELERRHQSYQKEIQFKDNCDYVIINKQGEIKNTKTELDQILRNLIQ